MKNSKLSIKLLWYVTPLVIVPLLFLGGFALSNVNLATEQNAELIVNKFIEQQRQKIYNYTQAFHNTMELLANSPVLSDFLWTHFDSQTGQSLLKQKQSSLKDVFASYTNAYPDILSVDLVDSSAQSLAYFSSDLFYPEKNYRFIDKIKNQSLRRLQLMEQNDSGSTSLFFVQKIFKSESELSLTEPRAFLIVHLDPSVISTSIAEAPYENTVNLITDENGKILFSSDFERQGSQLKPEQFSQMVAAINQNRLVPLNFNLFDNRQRMLFGTEMAGGIYYFSLIPKDILYESGKNISLITGLIVILAIIILPGMIFLVVKTLLLAPIEELAKASHRVGDGDLTVLLNADSEDEISDLFKDFNHMVSQIRDYQGQLEDYKQHLEEKVLARTHALAKMNRKLEKAIDQAEQANHLKSRFLANMSHEIRTPLTAIMGFTEQMLESSAAEKPNHRYLTTIQRNSRHLLELINNILDLSKIEAEKLELDLTPVCMAQLFEDIESIIHAQAVEKSLDFHLSFDFPIPQKVNSDITRLKQILLNICSNAVKFTESGQVELKTGFNQKNNQLIFTVKDTGIGMSQQEVSRIFKPFEQADSGTTRKYGGTGLGLCISRNLAQLLGGDVQVNSQLEQGSEFMISVRSNTPLDEITWIYSSDQLAAHYQQHPISNAQFNAAKVLVAEDNEDNQALLKLLLESWGIFPIFAENGAQAAELALNQDFDLILMDMQMPTMNGLDATRILRHAAYSGPIIAITANVMKHDVDTYIAAGCDGAIAKPINKRELEAALQTYLQLASQSNEKWDALLKGHSYQQITAKFRSRLSEHSRALKEYYQNRQWQDLRAQAHNLKGSAGCFGFTELSQSAAELEQAITNNKVEKIEELYFKLQHTVQVAGEKQVIQ